MPVSAPRTDRFTAEEYLRREAKSLDKHEYHDGEILVMTGGTYRHSRISANTIRAAGNRLDGTPCFVLESNMRVSIPAENRYVYPDASIVCGEPAFDPLDKNQTTILNPRVVVEVSSDSTEGYDRGWKFRAYRTLTSFSEYVMISQIEPAIETYARREDGLWTIGSYQGLEAVARLLSIDIDLPLAEVYAGLSFDAPPAEPAADGGAAT